MLKKYLFIVAAIFAVIGFQSQAFAVPTSELVFTADMTEEQLQAELAKADNLEAAVQKAIGSGADASQVVIAAVQVNPDKFNNIKAAAKASVPAGERAAIDTAAEDGARAVLLSRRIQIGQVYKDIDGLPEVTIWVGETSFTLGGAAGSIRVGGGGATTSFKAASEAKNG